MFKKKDDIKRQNTTNSVYTLKFAVPFFSIFDKTDSNLQEFPIKLAIGGSVQYRIADPDLCFDNVPLREMSPEQLEEHVKDSLTSTIKTFISNIDNIPILQFESTIGRINDLAKAKLVPSFDEEFGISLRSFNITRFTYDETDANFIYMKSLGTSAFERKKEATAYRAERDFRYENEDIEEERERRKRMRSLLDEEDFLEQENRLRMIKQRAQLDEVKAHHQLKRELATESSFDRDLRYENEDLAEERERRKRLRRLQDDEEMLERENRLRSLRQQADLEESRAQHSLKKEIENDNFDLEKKRRELTEEIHARRTATDSSAKLSESLSSRRNKDSYLKDCYNESIDSLKSKYDDLDLGSL